jgi:hypothetical protein
LFPEVRRAASNRLVVSFLAMAVAVAALGAPRIEMSGAMSFTRAELDEALSARPPEGDVDIAVTGFGVDVEVARNDKRRRVALGERRGPEAARVVALVVWDLSQPEATVPTLSVSEIAPSGPSLRFAVSTGLRDGLGERQPMAAALALDLDLPLARHLRGTLGLAWTHIPERDRDGLGRITFDAWALRAGLGLELGPVQLLTGPFVAPYYVRTWLRSAGIIYGASLSTLLDIPVTNALFLRVGTGLDFFGKQTRVVDSGGRLLVATPRVAFVATVGMGWDFGR